MRKRVDSNPIQSSDPTSEQLSLLSQILRAQDAEPAGVNALKFNAKYEEHLADIRALTERQLLERKDNSYFVRLHGLAELAPHDPDAERVLFLCKHVFGVVRKYFKKYPGEKLMLRRMVKNAQMPDLQVRKALQYLIPLTFWAGYSNDLLSRDVYVIPGERILDYPSFEDVLAEQRRWAEAYATRSAPPAAHAPRRARVERGPAQIALDWQRRLPKKMRQLYVEVHAALEAGQQALPAMGMRAILDLALSKAGGGDGNFPQKLNALVEKQRITEHKRKVIHSVLEVGHAASHRGHFPTAQQLRDTLACLDNFVFDLCNLDAYSERLRGSTPARTKHPPRA